MSLLCADILILFHATWNALVSEQQVTANETQAAKTFFHVSPENDKPTDKTECYPFSALLLQSKKVLFAEDCNRYITSYRSIAQTVLVAIHVAPLKANGIWATGGFAQTVLVGMPTVCLRLQI